MESCLKTYIGRADKSGSDVEKFPLGRLLKIFSTLNANTELQKRLNKLLAPRNHIAHKALFVGANYDVEKLKEADESFSIIGNEVKECVGLVIEETKMLKALQSDDPKK